MTVPKHAAREWFTHSSTVSDAPRRQVAAQLADYTATVADYAAMLLGEDTTVAVSGSLARGEPSVRRAGDRWVLGSDVDLVVIPDDAAAAADRVAKLVAALRESHPEIDTTAFTVERDHLPRVAGRFGCDLSCASATPLAGPAAAGPSVAVGAREGLEGLVHQLATIYCPDSPPEASPWRLKTALEALRANTTGTSPRRYSDLPDDPAANALLNPVVISALVQAREHNAPSPLAAAQVYQLTIAAATRLFGATGGQWELIAALHALPVGAHLLDGFQHAIMAATVHRYGPAGLRRHAATALHVIASRINPDTVPTAADALYRLTRISPADASGPGARPAQVIAELLRELRRDYYGWLGPHNFGANPVADYTGPTPNNGASQ
ncbi:hypothetical protein [Nocardia wallacei]|uniref:Uncharacterized protein n=1 Tax=Nocardia wallacei TaxID=480035 RepID=A0A7G1L217_9NOCA|nr:hypothetical protein [Nocardia wallacei]BCK59424.1 hypothetical protein NWFMUON74_71960 [Nocardia wallacei]